MIQCAARTAVAVAMVSLVFGLASPTPGRASSPGATLVGFNGDCLNSAESVPFIPGPSVYLSECVDVFLRYAPPVIGTSRAIRVSNGSCLEADGVASTIGVLVSEQACDASPRQQWTTTPTGEIVNLGSSLCLAPLGPAASTGSTIGTVVCDGGPLQRWRIRSHGRFHTIGLGDGADVTAVATSPEDGHLWLGTNGGVFRSIDHGASFFRADVGLPAVEIETVAVASDDPKTAWARGARSLYRTVDGGRSWQRLRHDTAQFGLHPTRQRLWAFTVAPGGDPSGTLRSDDRGATWIPVANPRDPELTGFLYTDLAFAVDDPERLWISMESFGLDVTRFDRGVWTTADGGDTWQQVYEDDSVHQLASSADEPTTVYASTYSRGILESRDLGSTWTAIDGPTVDPLDLRGPIALDGTTLYAAALDGALWAFDTVERTWTAVADALTPLVEIDRIHIDPRTDDRLYVEGRLHESDRAGLLRSDDGGRTWALYDNGLRVAFADRVAAIPNDTSRLFASVGSSVYRSIDGGQTWSYATGFGPADATVYPPTPIAVRAAAEAGQPPTVWAGRPYKADLYAKQHMKRSDDGGITWDDLTLSAEDTDVLDIALDPDDPSRLYAAAVGLFGFPGSLYRSTDDGETWVQIGPEDAFVQLEVVGDGWLFARSSDALYRSDDDGVTWTEIGEGGSPMSAARWDGDVVVARGVGFDRLELSTDGGTTWTTRNMPGCASNSTPTLHPTRSGVIVLHRRSASTTGCAGSPIWISRDGGERWIRLGGLTMRGIAALEVSPTDGVDRWLAATLGNGVAEAWIDDALPVVLRQDRFSVSVAWRDAENRRGTARPVDLTSDSGLFWFFGPDNLEILIKVLDGREINGHFWILWGAATDVGLDITVTDHATGEVWTGNNPVGTFASGGDVEAFSDPDIPLVDAGLVGPASNGFRETGRMLPLGEDDRFVARVTWSTVDGRGDGLGVELAEDTGGFWFFDGANVELLVKVLDARAINGHFWVFWGSTSNVAFDLCIEDTVAGVERCWQNPDGTFASGADTDAFDG